MIRRNLKLFAAAAILLASPALGETIRINKGASIDPRQDLRLGDIATIAGADSRTADQLANLVILPDVREGRTLRAEAILMSVITQIGQGKLADRLQISGAATCDIKLSTAPHAAEQPAPAIQAAAKIAALNAAPAKETPTLANLLLADIQQNLNAPADDLRITFSANNPLLDQPAPVGKHWALRPLTRTFLGTVQYEAQLIEGNRVEKKSNIQLTVMKRERILVAAANLVRGEVVTKNHFRADEDWIDRPMPTLLQNEKDVIGLEALRPVAAGAKLDQRDFRPVEMAARGDAVSVVFNHGSLKIQSKGIAQENGKLHDSIKIKNVETNEIYQAMLIGKQLAVVGGVIDESLEKQLRETR